jgi:glycosyltransferase involved in cell wall biosynthesis
MTKKLRIALIMQGGRHWMGGAEYIKNIILALGSLPSDVRSTFELCLICSKSINKNFLNQIDLHLNNIYYEEVDLEALTVTNRIRWKIIQIVSQQQNPRLEALLKKENIDFIYPYLSKNTTQKPYRSATWIPDFQHKYLPQFFTKEEIEKRDKEFSFTASHASTVVLSSKDSESDFHKLFPESADKTKVISFKTSPTSDWYEGNPEGIQQEYYLPNRFFLVSNQFWQHKNHLVIFKALKLLQEKSIYPVVVCTGNIHDSRQPDYSDTILQTIHKLDISKQVYLLGLIPKFHQVQLMRRSLAVIQPSLFEGWSTLVEDARCLGKRMILSDLPVNIEQNPPNSTFFERNSPDNLASLLANWWEHLSPGPDIEQEAIAKTNNIMEVQEFGYRFLEMAKSG